MEDLQKFNKKIKTSMNNTHYVHYNISFNVAEFLIVTKPRYLLIKRFITKFSAILNNLSQFFFGSNYSILYD